LEQLALLEILKFVIFVIKLVHYFHRSNVHDSSYSK